MSQSPMLESAGLGLSFVFAFKSLPNLGQVTLSVGASVSSPIEA